MLLLVARDFNAETRMVFRKIKLFHNVQILRIFCIPHVFRKVQLAFLFYMT